ncbi:hypothetical protein BGZ63DRAFT_409117 [Mariannaea sp. PMI_226]|nr:hypothetical protein BGZ63DRAFT_409117 [Mariannaea sp. PMI_226]
MRFQLKHILPLAVLLTGVVAKSDPTADSSNSATETGATTTDDSTATATGDDSNATETGSSKGDSKTATGKQTGTKTGTEVKTTASATYTDTWKPTIPATTAPDLESAGVSLSKNPNYIIVTLSVGLLTAGMNFL